MAQTRIGISGWRYEPWRGVFYPKKLAQKRELEYASRQMNSIEINGTFYSLQTPASYRQWASETPQSFLFAIKGPKFISHRKRLKDVRIALANFLASGLFNLGHKIGPILWQFPHWERFDDDRFESFLHLLPKSLAEAAELASENTIKDQFKSVIEIGNNAKLRYAFELRHESFFTPAFIKLLRKYNAALVFADTAGKWPFAEDVTADFIYIRLHGSKELYASGYTPEELERWAERIRKWASGKQPDDAVIVGNGKTRTPAHRDVFAYFDNDIKVHAPYDAIQLAKLLGIASNGSERPPPNGGGL